MNMVHDRFLVGAGLSKPFLISSKNGRGGSFMRSYGWHYKMMGKGLATRNCPPLRKGFSSDTCLSCGYQSVSWATDINASIFCPLSLARYPHHGTPCKDHSCHHFAAWMVALVNMPSSLSTISTVWPSYPQHQGGVLILVRNSSQHFKTRYVLVLAASSWLQQVCMTSREGI